MNEVIEGLRLSPQQRHLWSLQQHHEALPYCAQVMVRIDGPLDVASLKTAIEQVVERHEILRTTFYCLPGMTIPLQVINESSQPLVTVHDLQDRETDQQEIENLFNELRRASFDLTRGPLMQVSLVKISAHRNVLLVGLAALNGDATGLRHLVEEISRHYLAVLHGECVASQPMQYADSSEWHNDLLEAPEREEGRAYWREQDFWTSQLLELPCKTQYSEDTRFTPEFISTKLEARHAAELDSLAEKYNLSPSLVLLACWQVLLWRLSSQPQIVIGCATDGRAHEELETALGLFERYLPARSDLHEDLRFVELLQQLDRAIRELGEYQEYFTWREDEEGYSPFCYEYAEEAESYLAGEVRFSIVKEYACTERYEVKLSCARSESGLRVEFHYDASRYHEADMQRLGAQYQRLLESVLTNEQAPISELEVVSESEREQQLVKWNETKVSYGSAVVSIVEMFERQVAARPQAVAVVCGKEALSYAELNQRANQLGHYLRSVGVGPEVQVGLCVERSLELLVGVLGILKAGGAYVPLDPGYPAARLELMLSDCGAAVVLTQAHLLAQSGEQLAAAGARVLCLEREWSEIAQQSEANPEMPVAAENLAYVIYTSGSTGRPKGVGVTQGNLVHTTRARELYYGTAPGSFLLLSSIAFDSSVAGLFWTLCGGGRLVVPEEGMQREVQVLVRLVQEQKVTHLLSLPSLYALLLEEGQSGELAGLAGVIVAGEACGPGLVQRHHELVPQAVLYNEYGPTEGSVWSTVQQCAVEGAGAVVPIGRPIANVRVYLLDQSMRLGPLGVSGELYVGGAGVTRGYLNDAALTALKYVPDPYGGERGGRLYRTGDLGRYRPEGELEFVGRVDGQVKIRGYRVEVGEIEAVLGRHAAVASAVVLVRAGDRSELQLVGYVVGEAGAAVSGVELRAYLRERLPDYMVPTWIVLLDELPLAPNGKVNRRALPPPEQSQLQTDQSYVAPRTQTEEIVSGVWTEVLGLPRVSVEANFFELGGHSLLATLVMSRLKGAFGVELYVRRLFDAPTVRGLSAIIDQEMTRAPSISAPPITPVPRDIPLPLSFAQQRLWFIDQLDPLSTLYNIPAAVRLKGRLDVQVLEQTLSEIVRRHESFRTTFAMGEGEPVQVINPAGRVSLSITDLSGDEEEAREARAHQLADDEAQRPFDLSRGPLLRAQLLRLSETEHVVLLTMHHIAGDGWSLGLLVKEVVTLYSAYIEGLPSPLPELAIQYADFAHWQREWLQGDVLEEHLSYWRDRLADAPALLELPTDRARPAVRSFRGAHQGFSLSAELTEELQQLSRREGVTLFMTLLAAFQALLAKYANQEDIVVGTDIANRNRAETEGLIGFFVNQLVLRTDLSGNPHFDELLRRVREVTLGGYAHQDVPFEKLVEVLNPDRGVSRTPLFQVKLVLQNAAIGTLELSGLTLEEMASGSETGTAKFDLMLTLVEQPQGLSGTVEYSTELYEAATIARMTRHFETLLGSIVAQPGARLDELEYLTASEAAQEEAEKRKHEQSKFKKFKSIKPQVIDSARVELVKLRRLQAGKVPLVVEPNTEHIDLADWARNNQSFIESNLYQHGGLLFRGFELYDESDFEHFLAALSSSLMQYMEGATPRTELKNKIYTSTEYPADQTIALHNELTYVTSWPMKIWFFCIKPAEQRGETPIADVRQVYQRIDPEIRQRFRAKGWMLVRNFGEVLSLPWQTSFHMTEKAEVEAYCKGAAIEFEWKDKGGLRTRQVRPAIAQHPVTSEAVWFNHVAFWHVSSLEQHVREAMLSIFQEDELPYNTYYGDGSRIEDSVVAHIRAAYDAEQVEFGWQRGDILMLDNMLVAHGRNPFAGSRRIVVAMGDKSRAE